MALYVGIDGGGTKTEVFVLDTVRRVGTALTGEATNPNSVGWDTSVRRIVALVHRAVENLGSSVDELRGLCAALSGVGRSDQQAAMTQALRQAFPSAGVQVVIDPLAALSAGTRGRSGLVLVAGTGSICVGEDEAGRVVRSGGFGYLIGDEGSGFDLGRRGLMAAIQGWEGRAPATRLWDAAAAHFHIQDPSSLIPLVYQAEHPVGAVASFARCVLGLAGEDPVAEKLVSETAAEHVKLIESVMKQFSDQVHRSSAQIDKTVVAAGGLFTRTTVLLEKLRERLPAHNIVLAEASAAAGAALRAMKVARNAEGTHTNDTTAIPSQGRNPVVGSAGMPHDAVVSLWMEVVRQVERNSRR